MRHRQLFLALATVVVACLVGRPALSASPDDPEAKDESESVASEDERDTKAPPTIRAADADAIRKAMGKEAIVEGDVASAAWRPSGRVMIVEFKGTTERGFMAAALVKSRESLDKAFDGDVAKALDGKRIRVRGTIKEYRGRAEILIDGPTQVEIVNAKGAKSPDEPDATENEG